MAHPMTYDEICIQNARLQGMVTQAGLTARLYMKRSAKAVALLRRWRKESMSQEEGLALCEQTDALLSAVDEQGDAGSEGENAHDDGKPLEGQTQDRDEPSRD